MKNSTLLRNLAVECAALAEVTGDPNSKVEILVFADQYKALADLAELVEQHHPKYNPKPYRSELPK